MVKAPLRESTPLLGGTDSSVQDAPVPDPRSRTRRQWGFAVSGVVLLCGAGALVTSSWKGNEAAPFQLADQVSSFNVETSVTGLSSEKAAVDTESLNPATAEFYKSLEMFKNENADPCVDFYEYACGGWLAQHEIPSDRPEIDSAFYAVGEDNKKIIQKIIDSNPPLISEFYASCLNAEDVDKDAVAYVAKLINSIHQINSTVGLLSYAGELDQSYGISSFFSVGVGADPKDPTTNLLQLSQGGLTLPSREYYLEASKSEQYAALFTKYMSDLFAVDGLEKHNASEYASAVYDTETKFAEISLTNAELRDPWTTNDAFTFADINAKYPYLAAYLNGISKQEPFPKTHAIVGTPAFFAAQSDVLKSVDVQQLKQYLSFHVLDSFGATLGEYFRRASHDFHGTVRGAGSLSTRDKFCVDSTTSYLGAYLGEYYMAQVFGPDAKASAQALVQEIEASMKRLLQTEEWLDRITYDAAVAKLERVRNYIGGPDAVPDLPFELHADNYFDNVVSLLQLGASETIQGVGEPVDATKWDMFASTVNAYYDPSANKMVFPAAILQPPFYSADKFPAAANYARIGMVMGHELSHGFDDQGRDYDGNGTLRKWWSASVSDDFTARAQCLSAQYSSFPVVTEAGVLLGNVNGDLTLGENIADNGGIHLAYQAYKLSQVKEEEGEEPETPAPEMEEPTTVPVVPVVTKEKKKEKKDEPVDEKDADDKKKAKADKDEDEEDEDTKKSKSEKGQDEKKAEKLKSGKDEDKKKAEKSKSEKDGDEKDDKKSKKSKSDKDEDKDKEDEDKKSSKKVAEKKPSKKEDKDDEKDDNKSKKVDEKEDKEDKKSKDKKPKKGDDEKDEKEDKKRSKKSKKDNDEEDEDDKKKSKKSSKDDGGNDGNRWSKHKSKKANDDADDDDKRHYKHSHETDDSDDEEWGEKKADKHPKSSNRHYEHDEDSEKATTHKHDDGDEDGGWKSKWRDGDDGQDGLGDSHHRYGNKFDGDSADEEHWRSKDNDWDEKEGRGEDDDDGDDGETRRTRLRDWRFHHHHRHHNHLLERGRRPFTHHDWNRHSEDEYEHVRVEHFDWRRHRHYAEGADRGDGDWRRDHDGQRGNRDDSNDDDNEYKREPHPSRHRHSWGHGHRGDDEDHRRSKYDDYERGHFPFESVQQLSATKEQEDTTPQVPTNSDGNDATDDRLFFTAFAQSYCEKRTPAYAELLRTIDPHSPGRWRVNGPLVNFDKFAAAFQCKVGSPMNPVKKCPVW